MSAERIEFGSENDYGRKVVAENYLRLVNNSEIDISPTLLYGGWGVGKTKFCKKLMSLIEEENKMDCIYLDAFLTDHIDDPLLSVVAALYKDIPENEIFGKQIVSAYKSFLNPNVLYNVTRSVIYHVANSLSNGAVNAVVKTYDENVSDSTQCEDPDFGLINLFKNYGDASNSMNLIRDGLARRCENKPVLLIVDELDRCKPTYAIEMLEVIKHFLEIPNLHILLVANKDQLYASIENHYGLRINSHEYLEKFFQYSFELFMFQKYEFNSINEQHNAFRQKVMIELYQQFSDVEPTLLRTNKNYSIPISEALSHLKPSIRQLEILIKHVRLYRILVPKQEFIRNEDCCLHGLIATTNLAIIAYCFHPKLRQAAVSGNLTTDLIAKEMFGIERICIDCKCPDDPSKGGSVQWILVFMSISEGSCNRDQFFHNNIWWSKYEKLLDSGSFDSFKHFINVIVTLNLS